jgi:hypothetical protein
VVVSGFIDIYLRESKSRWHSERPGAERPRRAFFFLRTIANNLL